MYYQLEKIETIIWMLKYGFNKVRGSKFKNINLSIKEFEEIRDLVKQNIKILNKYEINQDWEVDLNNCIKKEKKRHRNTTCFICAKKGHFAIDCRELYDIDAVYIGEEKECKYCNDACYITFTECNKLTIPVKASDGNIYDAKKFTVSTMKDRKDRSLVSSLTLTGDINQVFPFLRNIIENNNFFYTLSFRESNVNSNISSYEIKRSFKTIGISKRINFNE